MLLVWPPKAPPAAASTAVIDLSQPESGEVVSLGMARARTIRRSRCYTRSEGKQGGAGVGAGDRLVAGNRWGETDKFGRTRINSCVWECLTEGLFRERHSHGPVRGVWPGKYDDEDGREEGS